MDRCHIFKTLGQASHAGGALGGGHDYAVAALDSMARRWPRDQTLTLRRNCRSPVAMSQGPRMSGRRHMLQNLSIRPDSRPGGSLQGVPPSPFPA